MVLNVFYFAFLMLFAWECFSGTTWTWDTTVPIPMGPSRPRWSVPPQQSTGSAEAANILLHSQTKTLEKGHQEGQLSPEEEDDWIQVMPPSLVQVEVELWYGLLNDLRQNLEALSAAEKAVTASHFIRSLNHRATNEQAGYLLGHMDGKVAELLALLVVAYGEGATLTGSESMATPQWTQQVWSRIENFIPVHPGSMAARGQRMSNEMPCIMLTLREAPLITPPSSPDPMGSPVFMEPDVLYSDAEETVPTAVQRSKRVKFARVQVTAENTQSTSRSSRTTSLQVPISEGHICLRLNISQIEEAEEPDTGGASASTDICHPPTDLNLRTITLPRPAPGSLARHGLSWRDLVSLWKRLKRGEMTLQRVTQQHGQAAAEYIRDNWGMLDELVAEDDHAEELPREVRQEASENNTPEEGDEAGFLSLPGMIELVGENDYAEEVPQEVQREASESNTPEERDEAGFLSLSGMILPGFITMIAGQGDEEPDFMQIGYRIISRWRDGGVSLQSATNSCFLLLMIGMMENTWRITVNTYHSLDYQQKQGRTQWNYKMSKGMCLSGWKLNYG